MVMLGFIGIAIGSDGYTYYGAAGTGRIRYGMRTFIRYGSGSGSSGTFVRYNFTNA